MPEFASKECRACYRLCLLDYGNWIEGLCRSCVGQKRKDQHEIIAVIIANENECLALEKGQGLELY